MSWLGIAFVVVFVVAIVLLAVKAAKRAKRGPAGGSGRSSGVRPLARRSKPKRRRKVGSKVRRKR